jgi:hypothetical protein
MDLGTEAIEAECCKSLLDTFQFPGSYVNHNNKNGDKSDEEGSTTCLQIKGPYVERI